MPRKRDWRILRKPTLLPHFSENATEFITQIKFLFFMYLALKGG
ncbi:MAG: hypothetical protein ABIK67_00950 [candidate division WOR-3 bacterium]